MSNVKLYAKLRGRIREKFGTQQAFAAAIGRNPATVSAKLCGKVDWEYGEVKAACVALEIAEQEMHKFF